MSRPVAVASSAFLAALVLVGCAASGPPFLMIVCNRTSAPLTYEVFGRDPQGGEQSPPGSFYQVSTLDPSEEVVGRFGFTSSLRLRERRPYVPSFVDSLRFESPTGGRLAVTPESLLAHPEWWIDTGWSIGVVERDGALETDFCTEEQ